MYWQDFRRFFLPVARTADDYIINQEYVHFVVAFGSVCDARLRDVCRLMWKDLRNHPHCNRILFGSRGSGNTFTLVDVISRAAFSDPWQCLIVDRTITNAMMMNYRSVRRQGRCGPLSYCATDERAAWFVKHLPVDWLFTYNESGYTPLMSAVKSRGEMLHAIVQRLDVLDVTAPQLRWKDNTRTDVLPPNALAHPDVSGDFDALERLLMLRIEANDASDQERTQLMLVHERLTTIVYKTPKPASEWLCSFLSCEHNFPNVVLDLVLQYIRFPRCSTWPVILPEPERFQQQCQAGHLPNRIVLHQIRQMQQKRKYFEDHVDSRQFNQLHIYESAVETYLDGVRERRRSILENCSQRTQREWKFRLRIVDDADATVNLCERICDHMQKSTPTTESMSLKMKMQQAKNRLKLSELEKRNDRQNAVALEQHHKQKQKPGRRSKR